jgi:hypothetical protein
MHVRRPSLRSLQAHDLRKVTVFVPEECAEALRQFARELCDAQQAGPARLTPQWRTLSPSAELMVAPEYRARCAVRDTGATGGKRFHWTVTILGRSRPVAAGRAGELAEARTRAEMALGAYAAECRGASVAGLTGHG